MARLGRSFPSSKGGQGNELDVHNAGTYKRGSPSVAHRYGAGAVIEMRVKLT